MQRNTGKHGQQQEEDVLDDYASLSFMEKVRRNRKTGRSAGCLKISLRSLVVFHAPTHLYVFTCYVIPHIFGDYGPWGVYYIKVLFWFISINGLINWVCVILYDPSIRKSRDRPDLVRVDNRWDNPPDEFVPLIQNSVSRQNGLVICDVGGEETLPWRYCEVCEINTPPRARHCKICKKCVLKRDHHCYIVGNCIGFNNQRYFFVLAFHAMLVGLFSGYVQYRYLKGVYWPTASSWTDLVPPVALLRFLFGSTPHHFCLMVLNFYVEWLYGLFGLIYFVNQTMLNTVMEGKTFSELVTKVPIRSNNSFGQHMRSIFGDFWALNFLFPMVVVFRQRDDGIHWDGFKMCPTKDGTKKKWSEIDL